MSDAFKINKRSLGQAKRRLVDDLTDNLLDEIKDQLTHIKCYYEGVSESFVIEKIPCGNIIGSEEWSAAALDVGGDWTWSKMPNLDNITKWIITVKDPSKFGGENPNISWDKQPNRELKQEALNVANHIYRHGYESNYYIDSAIRFLPVKEVSFL